MVKFNTPLHKILLLLVFIIALLILIAAGIATTLHFTDFSHTGYSKKKHLATISILEAQLTCEEAIRQQMGQRLKFLVTDDHSSHYNEKLNVYKIFLIAEAFNSLARQGHAEPYSIYCVTPGNEATIAMLDIGSNKESPEKKRKKGEKGLFGY